MSMQRLLKLKKALKSSFITTSVEVLRSTKVPIRYRTLTPEEIETLEKNGNRCDDWSLVSVEPNFSPERINQSIFVGEVRLPAFFGTVLLPGDVSFPTGIYYSLVHNCTIENALVHRVAMLSNVLVRFGAVLQNVGSIVSSGKISYQTGSDIVIGNEMGGRPLYVFPDITDELIDAQLLQKMNEEVQGSFAELINTWRQEVSLPFGVVDKGAVISNTNIVRNSWIGPHARIEGASKIRNTVVLSSLEEPCNIYDSVIIENSNVQEGVKVHSGALVKNSVLMKRVKVGNKAIINSSIISSCCHIEEAEVTCSYVGPLTQMHHHSLLISTLWPMGGGNLGYGANVGSNHTGRRPDQELYAGQGLFFGLGVNIKFPANLKDSPFSIIATGVTCEPQRLMFPFSLIKKGTHSDPSKSFLNELIPGWNYAKNAYALDRNFYKYSIRGKGFVDVSFGALSQSELVKNVFDAYQRLQVKTIKDVYLKEDILGLGSNYLRETVRQNALKTYREFLERFVLDACVSAMEADSSLLMESPKDFRKSFSGEVLREITKDWAFPETVADLLKKYKALEKEWFDCVFKGLDRDAVRGREIFDDYDEVHLPDKAFIDFEKQRIEESNKRVALLSKELRLEA
jgi:carbonic anhydrase/acetyltransferase-like protein (isoleucine patch superfamily)